MYKKTTVYTHVNGDRRLHIENSKNKVILLCCCTLMYDDVQHYSNITFLFLLFLMCGLSLLTCV